MSRGVLVDSPYNKFRFVFGLLIIDDGDSHPSLPDFAETGVVGSNFFRRFNRERVASSAVVDTADHDSNDMSVEIQKRGALFSTLSSNICPDQRWGEITIFASEIQI